MKVNRPTTFDTHFNSSEIENRYGGGSDSWSTLEQCFGTVTDTIRQLSFQDTYTESRSICFESFSANSQYISREL